MSIKFLTEAVSLNVDIGQIDRYDARGMAFVFSSTLLGLVAINTVVCNISFGFFFHGMESYCLGTYSIAYSLSWCSVVCTV